LASPHFNGAENASPLAQTIRLPGFIPAGRMNFLAGRLAGRP
jgi:hypothetical protein